MFSNTSHSASSSPPKRPAAFSETRQYPFTHHHDHGSDSEENLRDSDTYSDSNQDDDQDHTPRSSVSPSTFLTSGHKQQQLAEHDLSAIKLDQEHTSFVLPEVKQRLLIASTTPSVLTNNQYDAPELSNRQHLAEVRASLLHPQHSYTLHPTTQHFSASPSGFAYPPWATNTNSTSGTPIGGMVSAPGFGNPTLGMSHSQHQGMPGGQPLPPVGHSPSNVPPRPKLTTTLWEDEGTLCYQVDAKGICVARRQDNDMINGTKLLNVVGMSRGKRDGILKNEKGRVVVKVGAMHLKGVWIQFSRAKFHATQYKITDLLYPLFVDDPGVFLYSSPVATSASASRIPQFSGSYRQHPCLNTFNNPNNPSTWDRQPMQQGVAGDQQQPGGMNHAGHHHMNQQAVGPAPGMEMNTRAVGLLSHQEHGGSTNSPNIMHSNATAASSSAPSSNSSSGITTPIDSASQSPHPGFRQQNGPGSANGGASQGGAGHPPTEEDIYLALYRPQANAVSGLVNGQYSNNSPDYAMAANYYNSYPTPADGNGPSTQPSQVPPTMTAADVGHSYTNINGVSQHLVGSRPQQKLYQMVGTPDVMGSIKRDSLDEHEMEAERAGRGDRDDDDIYGGNGAGSNNASGFMPGIGRSPQQPAVMRPGAPFPSPMSMSPSTSPATPLMHAHSAGPPSPIVLKRIKYDYSPRMGARSSSMPHIGFQHTPAAASLTPTLASRENAQQMSQSYVMYDGFHPDGERGQGGSGSDEGQMMDSPHGTPNSGNGSQMLPMVRRGSMALGGPGGGRVPSPRHHPYASMPYSSGVSPSNPGNPNMPPPHSQSPGMGNGGGFQPNTHPYQPNGAVPITSPTFYRPGQPTQGVGSEYSSHASTNNNHAIGGVDIGSTNMAQYQAYGREGNPNDASRSKRIGNEVGGGPNSGEPRRSLNEGASEDEEDYDDEEDRY
ncbi:hypothetical protein BC938DRAFT_473946 [Jimgerdemannia flammicorona]|uniref:HTH APSES-type domain-containing protein n=1 Tax=Jimgerdemannia flammicorona TaxID=994334 RepID=A0A433Q342_9FUNG|nr:hypothetical protein BC938DRAFT_473946 [Jimgerdemannia flammicorona]